MRGEETLFEKSQKEVSHKLPRVRGEDSGEGRWTIKEAIDLGVPAPSITASIFTRFASREKHSFSLKILAALRQQFGGHSVKNQ